ncbi:sugar 3,4-ketoisomerase [Flavobacterium ichthyis]|uniref:sugar 3,4-ketoisomerase n=1 Tax=Flavobacterium ichthyis TaxID=2698827 RepID=UPI00141334FE|nr:FdtA/QdtA family cupin domain-containing protein [Flavobacterium ichthyis]
MQTIDDCHKISLPTVLSSEGKLVALENNLQLPFTVRRVYYLYDIPFGSQRGGHAHKKLAQYLIAVSGSFTVTLDDGTNKKEIFLNNPSEALFLQPGVWREIHNFSSGSICLVLASAEFTEDDYIRDYHSFQKFRTL